MAGVSAALAGLAQYVIHRPAVTPPAIGCRPFGTVVSFPLFMNNSGQVPLQNLQVPMQNLRAPCMACLTFNGLFGIISRQVAGILGIVHFYAAHGGGSAARGSHAARATPAIPRRRDRLGGVEGLSFEPCRILFKRNRVSGLKFQVSVLACRLMTSFLAGP